MTKKKSTRRTSSRSQKKVTMSPIWIHRRIVVFAILLLFFLGIGFSLLSNSQSWYYFITAKEQFVPNDPTKTIGYFEGREVKAPQLLASNSQQSSETVLGDTSNKRIEVDLTNQRVYTYEGDNRIHEFIVSTGKYGWTPVGEFTIQRRVRAQAMKGGSKALGTYYYLPNVQFVQFFGNQQIPWWRGFSFHSTYWHNNFGHPMSHGCINMKLEDAAILWDWAADGVRVVIYGITPPS